MTNLAAVRIPVRTGSMGADRVKLGVEAYNALLEIPAVQRASLLSNPLDPSGSYSKKLVNLLTLMAWFADVCRPPHFATVVNVEMSHRSLSSLSKRSSSQAITLSSSNNQPLALSPLSFTAPEVQHTSVSPDGRRSAVFRVTENKDGKRAFIEIWDTLGGMKEEELEVGKRHGDFDFSDTFGVPNWSEDGRAIVYTAEALPTAKPPPGALPTKDSFAYVSDYGERFTGKKYPSVFLLVLPGSPWQVNQSGNTRLATPASAPPASISLYQLTDPLRFPDLGFGQAVFLPSLDGHNGLRVLATGYEQLPDGKKLGIVYCANRPARLYELELELCPAKTGTKEDDVVDSIKQIGDRVELSWQATGVVGLTPKERSSRSPRVFLPPNGLNIHPLVVYISNPVGGPHSSCSSLHAQVILSKLNPAGLG